MANFYQEQSAHSDSNHAHSSKYKRATVITVHINGHRANDDRENVNMKNGNQKKRRAKQN